MDPKIIKALEMVLANMKAAALSSKASSFGRRPDPMKPDPAKDMPADAKASDMPAESGAGVEGSPAEEMAEPSDEELDELLKK